MKEKYGLQLDIIVYTIIDVCFIVGCRNSKHYVKVMLLCQQ